MNRRGLSDLNLPAPFSVSGGVVGLLEPEGVNFKTYGSTLVWNLTLKLQPQINYTLINAFIEDSNIMSKSFNLTL